MTPPVCSALIGIYTHSGGDSISSFHGKEERKTFTVACEKEESLTAFANLGRSFELDPFTFKGKRHPEKASVARYEAFCLESPALSQLSMPPTYDALHQHSRGPK